MKVAQVAITKVKENGAESPSVLQRINAVKERVRTRAYELFKGRGDRGGGSLDDWLKAEHELIWAPDSDLVEKNERYEMQVAVPGFDPEQISVTASPDALTVSAESSHRHEKDDGDVHFCEFGERAVFRSFDLPRPIDVDKVTAKVEKGVLRISAGKAQSESKKSAAAA